MDQTYNEYRDFLYQFFIKHIKIRSLAEDFAQDVFVKFWNHRHRMDTVENLDAWLYTLARNHLNDHYRRLATEKKYQESVWNEMERYSNSVIKEIYKKELEAEIAALVKTLPPRQREIYVLSRKKGLSLDEIAEKLEISPNTVKNHLVQALKVLRNGLKPMYVVWMIGELGHCAFEVLEYLGS